MDDLSFLDDLDRGLELAPEHGRPARVAAPPAPRSVPAPAPVAHKELPVAGRPRPLLALFPSSPNGAPELVRVQLSEPLIEQLPVEPPPIEPPPFAPTPVPPAAPVEAPIAMSHIDDDLVTDDMFGSRRRELPVAADDDDALTDEILGNLREKPFSAVPDLRFLFHSRAHDRAMQALLTSIGQHDGCVVLTGDPGTGKSMTCRAVLEQIDHRTFTSFTEKPYVAMEAMLKAILTDFGVISRVDLEGGVLDDASQVQLIEALHEFLQSIGQIKGFAVVVIDNADALRQSLLEELRALVDAHPGLLGVVFVGSRELLMKIGRRSADANTGA